MWEPCVWASDERDRTDVPRRGSIMCASSRALCCGWCAMRASSQRRCRAPEGTPRHGLTGPAGHGTGVGGCLCCGGGAQPRMRNMLSHRSACLAVALGLIASGAFARERPAADLARCTVAASPSQENLCEPQAVRLGIDGAEAVAEMQPPIVTPLQVATFELNGVALISPDDRTVMAFPGEGTDVAAADETAPGADAEVTGSVSPSDNR